MSLFSIKEALTTAKQQYPISLEVELLLATVLNISRAKLIAYDDQLLSAKQHQQFLNFLSRRIAGEPIAYILEKKAFWDIELNITPDVLIPRPETELIVEWVLNKYEHNINLQLADLGTGSGAIAISLAHAKPGWEMAATDFSERALTIAKKNAEKYQLNNIEFYQGSWCESLPNKKFDIIVSNPPYIDPSDQHLKKGDLRFEPRNALAASDEGYADLFSIIHEAKSFLKKDGVLLLEHGFDQADRLGCYAEQHGYQVKEKLKDLAGHDRVVVFGV